VALYYPSSSCLIGLADYRQFPLEMLLQHPCLPPDLIEKTQSLRPSRRHQYLACRFILARLLKKQYAISTLPLIQIGDNQRPVFADTTLPDFNISHSQQYIAVAICSAGKIGLDIESIRPRKSLLNIANSHFSPSEYQYLASLNEAEQIKTFWQLWTSKEAALKLSAKGVWQMKQLQLNLAENTVYSPYCQSIYLYHQRYQTIQWAICSDQSLSAQHINIIDFGLSLANRAD